MMIKKCKKCPRLCAYLDQNKILNPSHFNAPVPPFGSDNPLLLIVGLAPGRATNKTGRPFTGDVAGELLYPTLVKFGWATGIFSARADDTIVLKDCRITNAVKCLPPENKPTGTEINNCLPYLRNELSALPRLKWILCLGTVAHAAVLKAYRLKKKDYPFVHGAVYTLPDKRKLITSYHCSKYNTSTKRLTPAAFEEIFKKLTK